MIVVRLQADIKKHGMSLFLETLNNHQSQKELVAGLLILRKKRPHVEPSQNSSKFYHLDKPREKQTLTANPFSREPIYLPQTNWACYV